MAKIRHLDKPLRGIFGEVRNSLLPPEIAEDSCAQWVLTYDSLADETKEDVSEDHSKDDMPVYEAAAAQIVAG